VAEKPGQASCSLITSFTVEHGFANKLPGIASKMDGNLAEDGKGFGPPNPFLIINISDNVIASSFGDLLQGSDSANYRMPKEI
jgi:hypothetical protein